MHSSKVSRHLHLLGATGSIRTSSFHGREHVVVPVVALVEGVIFPVNAETPELVLATEFSAAPQGWNGRPVVAGHPAENGVQISANSPKVLESRSFGTIFNTRVEGKRLMMEAWLDPVKAKAVGRDAERVIERALAGQEVEVSVGVFVLAENKSGRYGEKDYKAVWHEITPDHLAMLQEGVLGACSNVMGCGVRAAQVHVPMGETIEVLGGKGSGNFGHSGRPGAVGGSGDGGGSGDEGKGPTAPEGQFTVTFDNGFKFRVKNDSDAEIDKAARAYEKKHGAGEFFPDFTLYDHTGEEISGGGGPNSGDSPSRKASSEAASSASRKLNSLPESETKWVGKPGNWQEAHSREATPKQVKLAKDLKEFTVKEVLTKPNMPLSDFRKAGMPQHFVLSHENGDKTLVDTQGYDYARYTAKLPPGFKVAEMSQLVDAAGKRHSSSDEELIQAMHDKAIELGAYCAKEPTTADRFAEDKGKDGNCSCGGHRSAEGEVDMDKKARVQTLIDNPATLFTAEDAAMLEGLSDARLTAMEEKIAVDTKAAAEVKAAAEKTAADLKAAADKAADDAAKLAAAAAKPKTEAEWLAEAPESLRRMHQRAAQQEAAEKTRLVAGLKTAQAEYTEEELNEMPVEQLNRLSRVAKLAEAPPVDFSFRAPRVAADTTAIPAPPDMNARVRAAMKKGELTQ